MLATMIVEESSGIEGLKAQKEMLCKVFAMH
jgi:hypothetical protein